MENFENYGVVSLDNKEMRKTDGGLNPVDIIIGGLLFEAWKAGISYTASGEYGANYGMMPRGR